jgi:hypothetical protein
VEEALKTLKIARPSAASRKKKKKKILLHTINVELQGDL